MAARLERAVQRSTARAFTGHFERVHFRVRLTRPFVESLSHNDALGETTTAPTTGFGLVRPRPLAAWNSARAM